MRFDAQSGDILELFRGLQFHADLALALFVLVRLKHAVRVGHHVVRIVRGGRDLVALVVVVRGQFARQIRAGNLARLGPHLGDDEPICAALIFDVLKLGGDGGFGIHNTTIPARPLGRAAPGGGAVGEWVRLGLAEKSCPACTRGNKSCGSSGCGRGHSARRQRVSSEQAPVSSQHRG